MWVDLFLNIMLFDVHSIWNPQIGLLVLTMTGAFIPICMVDPKKVIRTDGTEVDVPRHLSWSAAMHGLWTTLVRDPMIILLFPMFLASNWFYTWRKPLPFSSNLLRVIKF